MQKQNKHILLMVVIFSLCAHFSYAQMQPVYKINSPKLGIIGGSQISTFHDQSYGDPDLTGGFHIGLTYNIPVLRNLSLEPQIIYIKKGAKIDYNNSPYFYDYYGSLRYKLHYLEMPLQLNIRTRSIMDFFIGGYASYLLNAQFDINTTVGYSYGDLNNEDFEEYDYGVSGGIAFNFVFTKLSLKYSRGLKDIAKSNSAYTLLTEAKNSIFSISLTAYL